MKGKRSIPNLIGQLGSENCSKVKLAITDIDGVLRGKLISFDKFRSVVEKGFGFCDVVFGWDAADLAYDNSAFTGWHTGYPDAQALVDLQSFRRVPWENNLPFFLADFRESGSEEPLPVCPRSLLKKIAASAADAGFLPYFSQEFEWFNFIRDPDRLAAGNHRDLQPMTTGMFGYSILRASQNSPYFQDLFDQLQKWDVPLEGLHTETGPGVYEAAILYSDVLEAADRAVLFKTGVKEIAFRHGILPTFMAKPNEHLPGCSGHVHQSLWSPDGTKNLFFQSGTEHSMSELMKSYLAGQLFCLPHLLPMYAPTVNSYKRLVEGAWAPTTLTWGVDNRTTALRVLSGSSQSTRLETRVVGSDSNPYLAMAACLASGLYGIRNKLTLDTAASVGSGYADKKRGMLHRNLADAARAMKKSEIAAELFGQRFVEHFTATREWEWRQFSKAVTDWELKRYMEII
jgi:glutamine synthetase